MNPLNYTTLEASKRLMETGVKLETDAVWFESLTGWIIAPLSNRYEESIPAYSFSTLWRELPESIVVDNTTYKCKHLTMEKMGQGESTIAYYRPNGLVFENINPCDALADLLVWVAERDMRKNFVIGE